MRVGKNPIKSIQTTGYLLRLNIIYAQKEINIIISNDM